MNYFIKPWDHQLQAINFAKTQRDLALFWEMGTGKTSTIINILRHKYKDQDRPMNTLILAPIVVLENWRREFKAHADMQDKYLVVLKGTGKKKAETIEKITMKGHPRILIGNYEIMQNASILEALWDWGVEILVCDESHKCKSHSSKRAKMIAKFAKLCKHRYILSGTPILNTPMDIFQQFKILDCGMTFGENFWNFRREFFYDKNAGMPKQQHFPLWLPKPGVYKAFGDLMSAKSLRITKEECLDLPPFIKETRDVELNPKQTKLYKEMRDDFVAYLRNKDTGGQNAFVATLAITKGLRLQQIVTGFCVDDEGRTISLGKTPRIEELKSLLDDLTGGNKVIIWACFKENYKQIAKVCEELKIGYTELHGGVKDKDGAIDFFRSNDECRVVIANPKSAGLGVNLIEASYSIYFSKDFSLDSDIQSEARNHRGGSEIHEKITRIDLVARGTIDEKINEALANKQSIAEAILDWDL